MNKSRNINTRFEDYLTTIYRLEESLGEARVIDIAQELSIRPATVSKTISRLESKGLVKREEYKRITLTPIGRAIAEKIIRKHRIAEIFLARFLGFNDLESHTYAHLLEHLPDVILERLHERLGRPNTCPHGNPVPGERRQVSTGLSILEASIGLECIVSRIAGEFTSVLEYIYKTGLRHGVKVRIIDKNTTSIRLAKESGEEVELPTRIARFIHVYCGDDNIE